MHPPSYRYLSCQSSGWSSRFDAAATTPRRALEIFALPLETAGLAARAAPGGARAANRGVADIAAGAVGIEIRARANRWPARARREMTLRCPRTRVALNIVLVCHRCHSITKSLAFGSARNWRFFFMCKQSPKTYNSVFPGKFGELRTVTFSNRRRITNARVAARTAGPSFLVFRCSNRKMSSPKRMRKTKNGRRSSARARLRMGGVGAGRGGARRRRGTRIAIPLTRGRVEERVGASRGEARDPRETSVAK